MNADTDQSLVEIDASSPADRWPRLAASWSMSTVVHLAILLALVSILRFGNLLPGSRDGDSASIVATMTDHDTGLEPTPHEAPVDEPAANGESASVAADVQRPAENPGAVDAADVPLLPDSMPAIDDASLVIAPLQIKRERPANDLFAGLPGGLSTSSSEASASPTTPDPAAGSSAGRGRRGSGLGIPQSSGSQTRLFGIEASGQTFVYVFDRSGSMGEHGGAPLEVAKRELLASLADLRPLSRFAIIFYNDELSFFDPLRNSGGLAYANERNRQAAQQFVRGVIADGGTEHYDAIVAALALAPDVVYFMTDADEPQLSPKQLAQIRQRNSSAAIHTIEFGYGPRQGRHTNFLMQLARENRGEYTYLDATEFPRPSVAR